MTIYGVDCASYQGQPAWDRVKSAGISFGFSKVSQGNGYVNPAWDHNLAGMRALGSGFMPGAYHFLESGVDAAEQARYFLSHLGGHVGELAIALDVEPSGTSKPGATGAKAWVAEFKKLTNNHPVIGYYPGWWWNQTGQPDLSFFDALWQSEYVSGGGSASSLYGGVPAGWWAPYGHRSVAVLQYSSTATVPGIAGQVDVNAFKGTVADLRALTLGGHATPTPTPTPTPVQEDDMPYGQLAEGPKAITPIALPKGRFKSIGFSCDNGLQGLPPAVLRVAVFHGANPVAVQIATVTADSKAGQALLSFADPANTTGISVQRVDNGAVHVAYEVS